MTGDLVQRLSRLDACAVSDALDRHQLPPAVVGLLPLTVPKKTAGRVVTVQLGPAEGRRSERHLCTAAVESAGPEDVIVIANDGRVDCAGWGGLLSRAAVLREVAGIVIDGACRDVPEAIDADLAVYGRAPVAVTARSRVLELSWGEPVTIAGVTVAAGDLVIADASGVAFVAQVDAEKVVGTAEGLAEREREMDQALKRGVPVSRVMAGTYEALLDESGAR
jgi:4-hydroxy-4-methyl-2-oxoglutarate aldolase